jgi:ubiquinone/menaquinone biosynthesis C-methylase UbiE
LRKNKLLAVVKGLSFEEASSRLLEELCVSSGYVLDVGTGDGRVALAVLEAMGNKGYVIGVDISRSMIEEARLRRVKEGIRSAIFIRACSEHLPFRNEIFDIIYSNFGLAHFENPMTSLDEMVRVLKMGGKIGIADYKHPSHIDVHLLFKKLEPATIIGWIVERLKRHCRTVSVPFSKENFYVVTGVK